ncbi:hypothetical protein CSUB01_08411 [Colletotrichum sublineola]|uniref:Uncharacterized protein n=1 Tax=Colletotrichum sublineola TaxID=1173701 RepID=A0A066XN66_COLSU|nr:hypothetical protein CSUB01_08411 [Colletotrichum sublineola]
MSANDMVAPSDHPEADFKAELRWWEPAANLSSDVGDKLDQNTTEKLNASVMRVFQRKWAPEAISETRDELKVILAAHPDLLDQVDTMFRNEKVCSQFNEYYMSEAAAGREAFDGSCVFWARNEGR